MEPKFNQLTAKRKITQFADKATQKIKQNTNIAKNITEIEGYIELTKSMLKKYSKSTDPPQSQQKKIKGDLLSIIDMMRTKNAKLKKENQAAQLKEAALYKTLKMNSLHSSELDNVKEDNFLLFNALVEKEAKIKKISNDLDLSKTDYGFSELSRDYYIIDPIDFIDEFEDLLKEKQDYLLKESRAYNKIKNKYNILLKERNALKKNINELLEINKKKKDNTNNDSNTKPNTNDNDRINDVTVENQKNNIELDQKLEEDIDIFVDVDIELNSDEENFETKVFDVPMLANKYEDKIKSRIPKIDLKQIEFNKRKIQPEIDINSLERRDNNESVDSQIRLFNDKIKQLKKRKAKGDAKIEKYTNYFEKLSKNLGDNQEGHSSAVFTISSNIIDFNSNPSMNNQNYRLTNGLTSNTYKKKY